MRIHHIALRSPHPEDLLDFYRRVLGLGLVHQHAPRSWWLSLDDEDDIQNIPSAVLMIERAEDEEPRPDPSSMDLLAFSVSAGRREHLHKVLAAKGIAIEHKAANTTYFRDPEGRRLAISQFDYALFLRNEPRV